MFCGFRRRDLSDGKVLRVPVIAFQKTKNSFKNICQELELKVIFLHSVQIKMPLNVIKTPLIPYISMQAFKAIFGVMNKDYYYGQR